MESLETLSLTKQLLGCWDDDHHIGKCICMMVLIGDIVNILSHRQIARQTWGWLRRLPCHRHIVQANWSTSNRLDNDSIILQIRLYRIGGWAFASTIVVGAKGYILRTQLATIQINFNTGISHTCRNVHRQIAIRIACSIGEHHSHAVTQRNRRLIIEVSTSMIPCVTIHLMNGVIKVIGWIERRYKFRRIYSQRSLVSLRDEVITIVGIRITSTARRGTATPTYRTFAKKEMIAIDYTLRNFLQVVIGVNLRGIKRFILQVTTIAIYLHLINISEASLSDDTLCQAIDTSLWHTNLCPSTWCQNGMSRIFITFLWGSTRSQTGFRQRTAHHLCLDIQHKTCQYLVLVVTEYQRAERNHQGSFLTTNRNVRVHSHLRRQGCTREAIIVGDVGYGHIHIFGILDRCRINRVLIIIWQRFGIHKTW